MPWLVMFDGEMPLRAFDLDREVTILGRGAVCDIPLEDHQVSYRHARIVRTGEGYLIEDLGSTNGTRVGDHDLTGKVRLRDGDRIEIGATRFAFSDRSTVVKSAVAVSRDAAEQDLRVQPEAKLRALLEIARALGGTIGLDGVLARILEALLGILPRAERGFILLKGAGADELALRASLARQAETGPPLFSRTIFRHVTTESQAVLCEDAGTDPRFFSSPSVQASRIRTFICAPLLDRSGAPLGVLQVDTRDERGRFDADDLGLVAAVAGPISVAIDNARLHEIAIAQAALEREARDARDVQLALVPEQPPSVPGYHFWHFYEPAHYVGGDYFDYHPLDRDETPPGRCAVAIGDVSGKGMPAALLMSRLSSEVRLLLLTEPDLVQLVERLNRDLCRSKLADRFITFLLVVLDAGRNELALVNAGHLSPLIRRSDGRVEEIGVDRSGFPLGIDLDASYQPQTVPLGPRELMVLYTDGIIDAGIGREAGGFGIQRLGQALAQAPPGVEPAGTAILEAVRCHHSGHDQFDDMTLICFGRT
jgi:serine phosphatase RsbU (regulator of sigma subunit)